MDKPKMYVLLTKNDTDDYEYWVTDDMNKEDSGFSSRGSRAEILAEVKEMLDKEF